MTTAAIRARLAARGITDEPATPPVETSATVWHTTMDIDGQPYPTRHHAPESEGDSDACLNLTARQLDYLRAIHEVGHAVTALTGGAHLHFAEIVKGQATTGKGGVTHACNLAEGHAYAIFSAAGERAADRWLREAGLWTPERAVAVEVGAHGDRHQFLAINPHVGFGDREVDYRYVHDLADQALDQHWAAVIRVANRLAREQRLDADAIVAIAGLPNGTGSEKCPLKPPTDPPARDWDESPAEAARYDRWWGDRDTDYDDED